MERCCFMCGSVENLRQVRPGFWTVPPEYTCEECFCPADDGPSFDDLPAITATNKEPQR